MMILSRTFQKSQKSIFLWGGILENIYYIEKPKDTYLQLHTFPNPEDGNYYLGN